MLIVNDYGQIEFQISHLQAGKLETLNDILDRYKNMDMRLFYHIVSSPTSRYESGYGKGRISRNISRLNAGERFREILTNGVIYGNPKGFFVNKHNSSLTPSQIDEIKSVSFSFASMKEMPHLFQARDSAYGICFFHDVLQDKGIRPVLYLNDSDEKDHERIAFNSPHIVEVHSKKYDMRWEHEWRVKGKLEFKPEDVAFLIVPDDKYDELIEEDFFMDYLPSVTLASAYTSPLDYLMKFPFLDNAWLQIDLFQDENGKNGLLMDFDEFPELLPKEREEILRRVGSYIEAFAKSAINELYEYRFTKRYYDFIGMLRDSAFYSSCFTNIENIKNHIGGEPWYIFEPWHINRALLIYCFEERFNIQKNRIVEEWKRSL